MATHPRVDSFANKLNECRYAVHAEANKLKKDKIASLEKEFDAVEETILTMVKSGQPEWSIKLADFPVSLLGVTIDHENLQFIIELLGFHGCVVNGPPWQFCINLL